MSLDDFCALDLDEFEAVYSAWAEGEESRNRDRWERLRLHASITIQPHVRKRIIPRQLIPLPWDNDKPQGAAVIGPALTAQERQARFERLAARSERPAARSR